MILGKSYIGLSEVPRIYKGTTLVYENTVTPPNTYSFNPSSEGIVEGVVNDTVALANTTAINSALQTAVNGGYTEFSIPTMDAYFNTNNRTDNSTSKVNLSTEGIILPSNLDITMASTTYLRAQPNDKHRYNIFSIWDVDNITITGGNLIGEKYDHTYTQVYTVATAASGTSAEIKIVREHVTTIHPITVSVSDATTNASEIASYLDAQTDLSATSSGATITLIPDAGLYVEVDDTNDDTSGINLTGQQTSEYGFAFSVYGSHNITIDNVFMEDVTGDNIVLGIKSLRNPSDGAIIAPNKTCENILVQNCTISGARRNNISPIDCNGATFNNNIIKDAAKDVGTLPMSNMDLECYRQRDENGILQEYARVENVIISNNTFSGAANGDIILFTCNDVEVFGNTFTRGIGNSSRASFNISIHDNVFTADASTTTAINIGQFVVSQTGEKLNYNYDVYNNTVNNYKYGIAVNIDDARVYNNTVTNPLSIGMYLGEGLENTHFYDNTITSVSGATGIRKHSGDAMTFTNVLFERETVDMGGAGLGVGLRIEDVTGAGSTDVNGVVFRDCNINGDLPLDIKVVNSTNFTFENCTYTTTSLSGNTNVIFTTP